MRRFFVETLGSETGNWSSVYLFGTQSLLLGQRTQIFEK
jgi:hypothetical protein